MSIDNQLLHIHIISDSIGATATKVAQATVAQFPEMEYEIHKHILIENEQQLIEALESAKQTHGIIFMTCLLYTSPSPRDATLSRMPSSA